MSQCPGNPVPGHRGQVGGRPWPTIDCEEQWPFEWRAKKKQIPILSGLLTINYARREEIHGSGFGKKSQPKEDPPLQSVAETARLLMVGSFGERNHDALSNVRRQESRLSSLRI
jgi:hypothetical protein